MAQSDVVASVGSAATGRCAVGFDSMGKASASAAVAATATPANAIRCRPTLAICPPLLSPEEWQPLRRDELPFVVCFEYGVPVAFWLEPRKGLPRAQEQ